MVSQAPFSTRSRSADISSRLVGPKLHPGFVSGDAAMRARSSLEHGSSAQGQLVGGSLAAAGAALNCRARGMIWPASPHRLIRNQDEAWVRPTAVSYTHLTLPTIYSV